MDLEQVETVLVQKMACGEPVVRTRAFNALRKWIREISSSGQLGIDSMSRLCKGLHYVMWMQDKMILQEEMADRIGSLLNDFSEEEQCAQFVKCMITCVANEWPLIDRWRMDKFLMLIRRLLRATFCRLRDKGWPLGLVQLYISAFKESAISPDKHFPDGLKFHFASVFLDELDGAGNAEPSLVTELLKPFADLLSDNSISQYLFKSIIDEIFLTILTAYEAEQASISTSEGDERGESANAENRLKFDNGGIAELLFNIGKNPALSGDRRKKLYHVSKKFKVAEQHSEFFRQLDRVPSRINTGIHRSKLKAAALRLLREEQKEVAEARRVRKNLESMKSPDIDVIGRKKNVRCLKKSNNAEDRRLFKHKKKLGVKKSRDILAKRSKKRLGGKKR